MKPERNAKTITAERMAKIERSRELLMRLNPQMARDAQNFKDEFGYCGVQNARPLGSEKA